MSFKQPTDVCIIANSKIIVSSIPYSKIKKTDELKKKVSENTVKKGKHKDPTDALSDIIAELDVDKISRNLDYENMDSFLRRIVRESNYKLESLVNEKIFCLLCKCYDYTLEELIRLLMEKYPTNFDIKFVKTKVKPFIINLQKEKLEYSKSNQRDKGRYKAIFQYL